MRTINFAFYRGIFGSPVDWLIALFSFGWASHVEAVFEDGLSYSSRPFSGTSFKRISYNHKWVMVSLHLTQQQYDDFRLFCEQEAGTGYDWTGVLAFIFPFLRASKTRWFCTDVLLAGLRREKPLTVSIHRTTPTQMYEVLRLISK